MKRALGAALAFGLFACLAPPVDDPATKVYQTTDVVIRPSNKVDVLFMIDNSTSMQPMASELTDRFKEFFTVFQTLAAQGTFVDLHIGVVTSDYGAGPVAAPGGCDKSPGGQFGKLQAKGAAATNCTAPVGNNYLSFVFTDASGNGSGNLPQGQDLLQTFTCMASVGQSGCGFEHQLESVYAALGGNLAENAGFLRRDALLAVVFVTNEDDGSAPPTAEFYSKDADATTYGVYDTYRQTRFGVECGGAPAPETASMGALMCEPAAAGADREYDVQRYIDLFTKTIAEGGIKDEPSQDIFLAAIDAPDDSFEVVLADVSGGGSPAAPLVPCAAVHSPPDTHCTPRLKHSCQNSANPGFFGDPALRLNAVVRALPLHQITSICDSDYSPALASLANTIGDGLAGCLTAKLATPANPDCTVEDQSEGSAPTPLPRCDSAPAGAACWTIEAKARCSNLALYPDGLGISVQRNGHTTADGTTTRVECATLAQSVSPSPSPH